MTASPQKNGKPAPACWCPALAWSGWWSPGARSATLDFHEPFIKDWKLETMAARAVSGH